MTVGIIVHTVALCGGLSSLLCPCLWMRLLQKASEEKQQLEMLMGRKRT